MFEFREQKSQPIKMLQKKRNLIGRETHVIAVHLLYIHEYLVI